MKKLMFIFASFALVGSAMAADGTETKFSGEVRARYNNYDNIALGTSTTAASSNKWDQRSKLGVTFSKGEDLMGQITLMHSTTWGVGAINGDVDSTAGNSFNSDDNIMWVYEAWGFWKAFDSLSFKIGRGALKVADGSVIDTNDYYSDPKVFEGILAAWMTEFANINFFGVKGFETDSVTTDKPEGNFYGVSVDVKNLPEALKMVNVHVLQQGVHSSNTAAQSSSNSMRYGITLGGAMSGFDYSGTYAGHSGETVASQVKSDTSGSMINVGAGYTFEDMMKAHLGVIYHTDSGDDGTTANEDEEYDPFHYESHYNAGMMDMVQWGNSTYIKVGASIEPWEMSKIGVDYYMFSRTENTDTANLAITTGTAVTNQGTNTKEDVGTEIDVYFNKAYSNGLSLGLLYGIFTPGDALNMNGTTDSNLDPYSRISFEAKMNF